MAVMTTPSADKVGAPPEAVAEDKSGGGERTKMMTTPPVKASFPSDALPGAVKLPNGKKTVNGAGRAESISEAGIGDGDSCLQTVLDPEEVFVGNAPLVVHCLPSASTVLGASPLLVHPHLRPDVEGGREGLDTEIRRFLHSVLEDNKVFVSCGGSAPGGESIPEKIKTKW